MREQGYRLIPVDPHEVRVLDKPASADIESVLQPVDLVTIWRRSEEAGAAVDSGIHIRARAAWLQEGVRDAEALQRAKEA